MKPTVLTYLEDTYLFIYTASIVKAGENEFGKYIILDSTIFYPQGGGQPTDTGSITCGKNTFTVHMVRLDEHGVVYHYGNSNDGSIFNKNTSTELKVNSQKRILNAKNHTAGHLIDIAVQNLGLGLSATKGYHFSNGSYVEYSGVIENLNEGETKEILIDSINKQLEILISKKLKIVVEGGDDNISNSNSPEGKSYRFVYFEGYKNLGCGCGGTHINSTGEFLKITIRKVRVKKGVTKISYEVE